MADEQASSGAERPARTPRQARRPPAQPAPATWRHTVRARLTVGVVFLMLGAGAIEARLVYLQVFQRAEMQVRASRQHNRMVAVPAKRGDIVDRNGHVLAASVDVDTVVADPTEIDDPEEVAALVCAALAGCGPRERREMVRKLQRDSQFAYVARKISPAEAARVRALQLKGVGFSKESRRYYPKLEMAAHVLGYVGLDNGGLAGLESTYDDQVRGRDGLIFVQNDARQHALTSRVERAATAGASLELTIDQYLQHIAERELRAGVEENRAEGGTALVMDPQTGEILALANWPTFNPNRFNRANEQWRRNRAVQDLYEPGSTFKVVTASAAFEEDVIAPEDPIDCAPGHITFGSRVIRDVHAYGVLSFSDVIVKSSNVGAIKVGLRLGPERLSRYVSRFGFGRPIGPDFPGENAGIVYNPARVDASALASMSMGYQVGVTPLQMATAVSSVANGGTLIEPRVVRAFIKDGRRIPVERKVIRQTISGETAAELTAIMEGVVERGTAKTARIPGFTVAGKTGTAAKIVNGRYSKSEYNASFIGFVPSRQPALAVIVVIDAPRARGYYGGTVAGPVFQRIAEASLRHLGIRPTVDPPSPVLVSRHGDPVPAAPRSARDEVRVDAALISLESGTMPDLRGYSAREALRALARIGITAQVVGQGFVVDQRPAPGEPLDRGEQGTLKLDRRPPLHAGGGTP